VVTYDIMSFAFQEFTRFPPNAVAIKIAMALAVGMLVGFERESASKDVGIRTFGLTALLGALSVMISPAYGLVAMAGVIVMIAFLNARSMIGSGSLEITTSAALLTTYALGVLVESPRHQDCDFPLRRGDHAPQQSDRIRANTRLRFSTHFEKTV